MYQQCIFGCVARNAVLLKPNFANNLYLVQHVKIPIAIDCNVLSLLIFEEKWPNYASGPSSDSFRVRRLFNVCVRVFWASSEKMIFFAKIGIFCKSIAGPLSEAKTHWIDNWHQLVKQLNFVWYHTKVFMENSSQWFSEMFNCWERRLIDVDDDSHTLSATAVLFSGVRTVFGFSRFVLSTRMSVSYTFFTS